MWCSPTAGQWWSQDAEDFSGGVFEDEDTRTFYEVLPDLRFLVPGAAAGEDGVQAAEVAETAPPESGDADGKLEAAAEMRDTEPAKTGKDALHAAILRHLLAVDLQPKAHVVEDLMRLLVVQLSHFSCCTSR